jgi:hypothetical protein
LSRMERHIKAFYIPSARACRHHNVCHLPDDQFGVDELL